MRLLSRLSKIKLGLIVSLIMAIIAGIVIYDRRPVAPEEQVSFDEYVIYAAVTSPDHIVFYKTFEGIELDSVQAAQAGLSLTNIESSGPQVSRVTFAEKGTKAWVRVGYAACGSDHEYIVGFNLLKDHVGWHKDGYSQLLQEVFC